MEITQSYLLGKFTVINGVLHRKISNGKLRAIDSYNDFGYVQLKILGRVVYAHRMVFLMSNGFLPEYVDHIDGNPKNNDPLNLRSASSSENRFNSRNRSNNTSGFKGVSFHRQSGKWRSQVWVNGVNECSYHNTIDDANMHAKSLREKLHGSFARHA